jgi:DNA-binding winged helix-turn-helix (wHTH) protein/thioredoxin-like negative regulator of GroEL
MNVDESRMRWSFNGYVIDARRREVRRDGVLVQLPGKAFDLLALLVREPGRVFSRAELYDQLWPEGSVEDGNLTQNVYLVRRALDPTGDGRRFVQTLPRYGYRFNLSTERAPGAARPRHGWRTLFAATLALVVAGSAVHGAPAQPNAASREALALGNYHLNLRGLGELLVSLRYFRAAVATAPQSADGYAGAATAYALLAEYEPAGSRRQSEQIGLSRRNLSAALARNPDESQAWAVAGFLAYRFSDDTATAQRDLERAIERDPENATASLWHGVLSLQEGRLVEAVADFETAHRLDPSSEVAARWLARAYTFVRRPERAIELADEVLEIEPSDAPARLALANAMEQRGDLRGARSVLKVLARDDASERRYAFPDIARLDLLLHREQPRDVIPAIDRLARAGDADPFEAALFYRVAGLPARATRLLAAAHSSPLELAIERVDTRS